MLTDREVVSILAGSVDESLRAAELLCTALIRPTCIDLERFLGVIATANPSANPQSVYASARDSEEALLRTKSWVEAGLCKIADIEIEEAVK